MNLDKEMLSNIDANDIEAMKAYKMVSPELTLPQSEATFLYAIWLVINIPCVGFGASRGFKGDKLSVPVRTSRIERELPEISNIPCHAQPCFTLLLGSLLTSLCVVTEMYYIITSIWRNTY